MPHLIIAFLLLFSSPAWAEEAMRPFIQFPNIDMTYPEVAGDYLVFTQRIERRYQVMRLNRLNLNAPAIDISPLSTTDTIRSGVAFSNGDIGYISNRLGYFNPFLAEGNAQTMLAGGTFNSVLLPNHVEASADAQLWVFDSTLDSSRRSRIESQLADGSLTSQLLGQQWRMYHEKYWAVKPSYPESAEGLENKFQQPNIFTFRRNSNEVRMLGDGFDADISPDGKTMVFVREEHGNFDLWLQNIDGSGLKRLTKNVFADLEPSFSSDGKRIAFVSNRDAAGDILQTSIYTLEIATGKIERLTTGSNVIDGGPAWLDSHTVIFHSNRDAIAPQTEHVDSWSLWTVNISK